MTTKKNQNPYNALDGENALCERPFCIVGIGASAGGLEALTPLLEELPSDTGMAFVFIQHLSPTHKSILSGLLSRLTRMPVQQAEDGMKVEPNRVYVIPPEMDIALSGLTFRLTARAGNGPHMPVDTFFRSLAESHGKKSVGIVLSGNGSDGCLGLQEIWAKGGVTFAQKPESAKFDGMPRSAIATGCVNFVLTPAEIAREILVLTGVRDRALGFDSDEVPAGQEGDLKKILELLRTYTGIDFDLYKPGTVNRRIQRRLALRQMEKLSDYLACLKDDPEEVESLCNDVLIKVTRFFRDPEMFETLKKAVFGRIIEGKSKAAPVRMWVSGCSTGEEVYSLAIALLEFMADQGVKVPIQIFGTDVSEAALEKARRGLYISNIAIDVSPERLSRFFTEVNGQYQISSSIREMCVFAKQDIVRDPPFSRLDLITCRNVMIYFQQPLQKRAMSFFHFALNPGGFIVLGPSESTGVEEHFNLVDRTHRIFSKKDAKRSPVLDLGVGRAGPKPAAEEKEPKEPRQGPARGDIQREADRVLLNKYAPSGVIVNARLEVIHFRGNTDLYLQNAAGKASFNLLRMVREGLRSELGAALREAQAANAPARRNGLSVGEDGPSRKVDIEVLPIRLPLSSEFCMAVLFQESAGSAAKAAPAPVPAPTQTQERVDALREELDSVKSYLESVIEQKESANEELQAANEEVVSSNEELQSINEELQTSKEELQSTNEELITVNDELANANVEMAKTVNDLNNLLESVGLPVLIVGHDLRIRKFTTQAEHLLDLIPSDIGRPFMGARFKKDSESLEQLISQVIATGEIKDHQLKDERGLWYSVRIHPYHAADKNQDGAVVVFIDVNELKRNELVISEARDYAEDILRMIRHPFLVMDGNLVVTRANEAFYRTFKLTRQETENRIIFDVGEGPNIPQAHDMLKKLARNGRKVRDFEVRHDFPGIGFRILMLNASSVSHQDKVTGKAQNMIFLAIEDVTEKRRAEESLKEEKENLEKVNRELDGFVYVASHDLQAPLRGISGYINILLDDFKSALNPEAERYLADIKKGANKMSELIKDLLTLCRISRIKNPYETVDVGALVEGVLDRMAAYIRQTGARVEVQEGIPPVVCDRVKFGIVIHNLISNAVKFSSKSGSPQVSVGYADRGADHELSVTDNGIGIDPRYHQEIFDMFRRLNSDEDFEGSGAGLHIVKKIVEDQGGSVRVESELGKGTAFYFTIPKDLKPREKGEPGESEPAEATAGQTEKTDPAAP